MAKKTLIDRAIANLEGEIAVRLLAVKELRELQQSAKAVRRPAKTTAKDAKTTT